MDRREQLAREMSHGPRAEAPFVPAVLTRREDPALRYLAGLAERMPQERPVPAPRSSLENRKQGTLDIVRQLWRNFHNNPKNTEVADALQVLTPPGWLYSGAKSLSHVPDAISKGDYDVAALEGAMGAAELAPFAGPASRGIQRGLTALERRATPMYITQEGVAPGLLQNTTHLPHLSERRLRLAQRELGGELGDAPREATVGGYWAGETNPMWAIPSRRMADDPSLVEDVGRLGQVLNQEAEAAHRFIPLRMPFTKGMASAAELPDVSAEELAKLAPLADEYGIAVSARPGGSAWLAPYDTSPEGLARFRGADLDALAEAYGISRGRYKLGVSDPNLDRLYIPKEEYPSVNGSVPLQRYDDRLRALGFGTE